MPFYNFITDRSLLNMQQKEQIAVEITDMHCELTGAPRQFVHVLFSHFDAGDAYTAAGPSEFSFVRAALRAGRSPEVKLEVLNRISDIWTRIAKNANPDNLLISIAETPLGNVMESGLLLPDPKNDREWMQKNNFQ